jgi:hypothetical protein
MIAEEQAMLERHREADRVKDVEDTNVEKAAEMRSDLYQGCRVNVCRGDLLTCCPWQDGRVLMARCRFLGHCVLLAIAH